MSENNPNAEDAGVPEYLKVSISSREEAEVFIRALHADGRLYHFDDSPETIIDFRTGLPTFTAVQCKFVRARVNEMFALPGFDPFDLAVDLS